MNFVAYYRVSTKKQARSGLGLEAQRQMVTQFAQLNGVLVGEYVEVESGRNDQRSELAKAMSAARKAKASLLIARLDRFSRRVSFIASMMEKGVQLVVAEMPHATDFQLHIFAALAQEERRLIAARTKSALEEAKKRGQILGRNGRVLAEFNKANANAFALRVRTKLPEEWRVMSYSALSRYLNDQGCETFSGARFFPQTVKNLIQRIR